MGRFEVYVKRRDEVSFNPLEYTPLRHDPNLVTHPIGSVLGAVPAALSGAAKIMPALKQGLYGNEYSSSNKTVYYRAFEQARDWLLNFAKNNLNLKISKLPIVNYLLSIIDEAEKYVQKGGESQIAGVTMGKQPSAESMLASPFVALGRSIAASLTNLRDTLDFPQWYHKPPEEIDKIGPNIEKMLLGLDMINKADKEAALDRLHEFKEILKAGGHAGYVDADARVGTKHPQFLFGEPK